MSFRQALNGKMLIGVFNDMTSSGATLGFDIPTQFGGKIDPNKAVAFMSVEDPAAGSFSYRISSFTSSRIEFVPSTVVNVGDVVRVTIVS